jgi:hypothetical protein
MKALSFWKAVTMDKANLLDEVLALLREHGIRFCVIGGQAVNAYVEPLVSLDLDLAVAVDQLNQVRSIMQDSFILEEFSHSLNVSARGSNLRIPDPDRPPLWRVRRTSFGPRSARFTFASRVNRGCSSRQDLGGFRLRTPQN